MYFQKSAAIAKAHKGLGRHIQDIDQHIYEIGAHPIRPDLLADLLDVDQAMLERILGLYVSAGTLRSETCRYCDNCETLLEDEHAKECDNCEAAFASIPPAAVGVFIATDPVIRTDEIAADPALERAAPIRVKFVAGDRGGSQRNQLQTPKEHGAIKSAIKRSNDPEQFALLDPVFAATMNDLSTLYQDAPDVIHFAGHADDRSLAFIQDQELIASNVPVTGEKLRKIIEAYPSPIRALIFNNCNSASIAEHLAKNGIVDIAVGWDGHVPDSVAIVFAELLYLHLGNGLSIGSAFTLAAECATSEGAAYAARLFCDPKLNPKLYLFLA